MERRLLGTTTLVAAGRRGAAMGTVSDSRGKPWDRGNLVITHKNTIEKVVEIDPEAADWTRRGAEMIAYEGKSAVDVARPA